MSLSVMLTCIQIFFDGWGGGGEAHYSGKQIWKTKKHYADDQPLSISSHSVLL